MKDIIPVILAAALSVGCVISARFFLKAYYTGDYVRGFWLKGMAALLFVAVGFTMLCFRRFLPHACLIVFGLFLGFLGDQLLAMRLIHKKQHDFFFTIGALSFGIGHILYMIALQNTYPMTVRIVLPTFLVSLMLSLVYAKREGTDVGKKTPLAVGYISIVLLMASVAICAAVRTGSIAGILFAVGGILFSISDNILCAYCYGKKPVWKMNRDLHIAYYGAQLTIAWSIFFI